MLKVTHKLTLDTKMLQIQNLELQNALLSEDHKVLVIRLLLLEKECNFLASKLGVPRALAMDPRYIGLHSELTICAELKPFWIKHKPNWKWQISNPHCYRCQSNLP